MSYYYEFTHTVLDDHDVWIELELDVIEDSISYEWHGISGNEHETSYKLISLRGFNENNKEVVLSPKDKENLLKEAIRRYEQDCS
jgi:hypothetical protein